MTQMSVQQCLWVQLDARKQSFPLQAHKLDYLYKQQRHVNHLTMVESGWFTGWDRCVSFTPYDTMKGMLRFFVLQLIGKTLLLHSFLFQLS